jgi:PAS domain S-box-containing protein
LHAIIKAQEKVIRRSGENERRLNMIADSIPGLVVHLDANLCFDFANRVYCDWHGLKLKDILGAHIRDIIGEESYAVIEPKLEATLAGESSTFEAELSYRVRGKRIVLIDYVPDVSNDGTVTGIYSLALDITDRKRAKQALEISESRFRDFAESSTDWLWETDENLCVTYVSDRFQAVTGIDPASYMGRSRKEFSKENTTKPKWIKHLSDLENQLPFRNFTQDVTTPDGRRLIVSSSAQPVFDGNGTFLGYRGTATDITDQRLTEEARDEALREAEMANRAKSEFLATMSHEFRTPLNAILGFSELIRAQYFGPLGSDNYRGYADDIHQSGEHMLALINDVLDMAAIEAGKRVLSFERCSVPELVAEAVRNLEIAARESKIEVISSLPEELPALEADVRSVRQILLNLLSNAIKFTPPDGQVEISADVKDDRLILTIRDTGIGIPEEQLANIAKPFSKLQNDPHIAQDGTGLGLSIVDSLVAAHSGALTIKSKTGAGTTVSVSLPIQSKVPGHT